jgi:hypothetical protein
MTASACECKATKPNLDYIFNRADPLHPLNMAEKAAKLIVDHQLYVHI